VSDVMMYIYTSGTTGYPKPTIIRHARFTMGGHSLKIVLGLQEGDCSYAPTPLYHGYSNFVGFAPAFHNGSAFASRRRFSARHFLDDLQRHGVTHFMYVGELCRYLLRQPPSPRDRQHRIRVATGPGLRPDIWKEFVERFGIARIIETYGQTEANLSLMNRRGRPGSVGRSAPFTHTQLKLVRFDFDRQQPLRGADGFLGECGPGEVGELLGVVSKQTTMSFDGYVNKADNEQKILRDCFAKGDVYLRTGDLLRRDRAGYYYFVDRIGDTFRWKGENVATAEVAELLNGAPGVSETAVYGVTVPGADGRAGMALVVLDDGGRFQPSEYYAFAERALPPYARPAFVRVAAEMDVTGTLKHTKRRLQEEGYDPARVSDPLYVRDDERRTYLPLDADVKRRIDAGRMRL
jgi:fatty-acyl-CoA synthase